jgi:hypothetical protein
MQVLKIIITGLVVLISLPFVMVGVVILEVFIAALNFLRGALDKLTRRE